MNASEITKNLEDVVRYGSMVMSKDYIEAVYEATLAFDAIRRLLKVQWKSEHNYTRDFTKEANEILSEFHLTEDEIRKLDEKYPHHLNGRPKCRDCIWLSDEKTVIGRKCVCPDKKFNTKTAMWKHQSNPVCRKFKRREEWQKKIDN